MNPRPISDDTLGIAYVDPARHRHRSQRFRRPKRTQSTADANLAGLGGRRLALGFACVASLIAIIYFVGYVSLLPYYPDILLPTLAWCVLAATVITGVLAIRALSTRLPDWLFFILTVGGALVVWLDLAGTAGLAHLGLTPTAAFATGVFLVPLAALRSSTEIIAATLLLFVVVVFSMLPQADSAGLAGASRFAIPLAIACMCPLVAVYIMRGFRRMVRSELDLVLVQSTVGTASTAVGMHASEELARLDYDAETLLHDIGSGRIGFPLPPEIASRAGELATQLRVRLIEGRSDTWLKHAVNESEYLDDAVTIEDPAGLAGLLSPNQRDSLLLAIWLFVGQRARSAPPLRVEFGPVQRRQRTSTTYAINIPVVLTVPGVARRRVDQATWDAIERVGAREEIPGDGALIIRIRCVVDSPADVPVRG